MSGRVDADRFVSARWELLPQDATCGVRSRRCAVVRSTARSARSGEPMVRRRDSVEWTSSSRRSSTSPTRVPFRGAGRRQLLPGDVTDLAMAERGNVVRLEQLRALRTEQFELMDRLAHLPSDMVFFTQITMEAAEDAVPDGHAAGQYQGALVGVEAVTPEGLKDVHKTSTTLARHRPRTFRDQRHVLGSFIFGFRAIARPRQPGDIADRAGLAFAQFVMLRLSRHGDFAAWEKVSVRTPPALPASRSRATG